MHFMSIAKNLAALALSALVVAGLFYSQLCAVSCAFDNCPFSETQRADDHSEQSGDCHHEADSKETPPAGRDRNRDDCPVQADLMALLSPAAASPTGVFPEHMQPWFAGLCRAINLSPDELTSISTVVKSYRSPPARAVISPLRI